MLGEDFTIAEGREESWGKICSRGSIDNPSTAVTSTAEIGIDDTAVSASSVEVAALGVYVPRSRNMAEGFSLEILASSR